jgi:tRNA(Ile)-lysidine synthetase-like protein
MQLLHLGIEPDYELVEQLRVAAERSVSLGLKTPEPRARTCGGSRVSREPLFLSFSPSEEERVPSLAGQQKARGQDETAVPCYAVRDRWGRIGVQVAALEEFSSGSTEVDLAGRTGKIEFEGARVSWRVDSRKSVARAAAGVRQEFFDADKVGSLVRLRHWQPGDRFQPIGMARAVKLQDFFTNQKIPRDRRRRLLVAATGQGEVFWVEGMRISERFKLTRQTIRRLQWRWERL